MTRASHLLWFIALLAALAAVGCAEERDSAKADAGNVLPKLALTDDTPELLLTWVDGQGNAHTATTTAEVPAEGRNRVRVITREAGHGQLFYVADLTKKKLDGSYEVSTWSRSEWEALIKRRRDRERAKYDEPRKKQNETGLIGAGLISIVYGAEWCKPCHAAAAYLQKRGLKVTEVDIEKQPHFRREMQRKLDKVGRGGSSIPVIDVGGIVVVGFNPRTLDDAIKRASRGARL